MNENGAQITKLPDASQAVNKLELKTGASRVVNVETHMAKFTIKESASRSAYHPLPFYWATHLMNALTADACICAYPTLTLRKKTVITNREYTSLSSEVQKYRSLGFTVFENAREVADVRSSCADLLVCGKRERMIGDRHTLVVPTASKNLEQTLLELGKSRTTCWKLGGEHCRNQGCFMRGRREVDTTHWLYNRVLDR